MNYLIFRSFRDILCVEQLSSKAWFAISFKWYSVFDPEIQMGLSHALLKMFLAAGINAKSPMTTNGYTGIIVLKLFNLP